MKKLLLIMIVAVKATTHTALATVDIYFGMGNMFSNTLGAVSLPAGALINLLALDSGTWTSAYPNLSGALSSNTASFTLPGTTLVGRIGNNNAGGPGYTEGVFHFSYSGGFGPGDQLLIVAYANRTTNSASPGVGANGFFFRTDAIADGSSLSYTAPADGGAYNLYSYTLDSGGSFPNDQFIAGDGSPAGNGTGFLGGGFTTVPEPSTYALLAMGAAALGGYVIRRRKRN